MIAALAVCVGAAGTAAAQPAGKPTAPSKTADDKVIERPIVGVIDLTDGTDPDAKALVQAITRAIAATPELVQVADSPVATALIDSQVDEDETALGIARGKLSQARDRMAELDLQTAITYASDGREDLGKVVTPSPQANDLLADLAFAEGQAVFAQRDQDRKALARARASFELVHRLSPGRTLDSSLYLDDLIEVFNKAAKPPPGLATLDVTAQGTIWIDGHEQTGDSHVYQVAPGTHWVVATGPEQLPSGGWAEVADGQRFPIVLPRRSATGPTLAGRARRALRSAQDPATASSAMGTIAWIARLTAAVLVSADKDGGTTVQLWRKKEGFSKIRNARQPWSSEAERTLEPLLPPKVVDNNTEVPLPPPPKPKKWYQKWWVRASLAAGVIGVIASSIAISNAAGASDRGWDFSQVTGREP